MRKSQWENLFFACGLIAVGLWVLWMFLSNFYFSESYDVLALNHTDDTIFHTNLVQMRDDFLAGNWRAVLGNTGFAYGNIYWLPLMLFTFPAAQWGPDWMSIVGARTFSVIFCCLCFWACYLIYRHRRASRLQAVLGLLLLVSCNGIFFATTCFHNHTLISAFVLWSLCFLSFSPTPWRRRWGCIFFGMALGLKVSVLFVAPVFLLFLNRTQILRWKTLRGREFYLLNGGAALWVTAAAALAFSPTVLLLPFGDRTFISSLDPVYQILFVAPQQTPPREIHLFQDMWENVFSNYYHWIVAGLGLAMSVWLFKWKKARTVDDVLVPLTGVLCALLIFLLVINPVREAYFVRFYVMPFIFIASIVFVDFSRHWRTPVVIGAFVALNFYLNFSTTYNYFMTLKWQSHSTEVQAQIQRLEKLKSVAIQSNEMVYIDSRIIFPFGPIERYKRVHFLYGGQIKTEGDGDVYIFAKNAASIQPELLAAKPPYEKIYEDEALQIVRRHREAP